MDIGCVGAAGPLGHNVVEWSQHMRFNHFEAARNHHSSPGVAARGVCSVANCASGGVLSGRSQEVSIGAAARSPKDPPLASRTKALFNHVIGEELQTTIKVNS